MNVVRIMVEIEGKEFGEMWQCEDIIPQYNEIENAIHHAFSMVFNFVEPRWHTQLGELLKLEAPTQQAGDFTPSLENYSVWKGETEHYSVYVRFYPVAWVCGTWH